MYYYYYYLVYVLYHMKLVFLLRVGARRMVIIHDCFIRQYDSFIK
jgi:hypothetical protein